MNSLNFGKHSFCRYAPHRCSYLALIETLDAAFAAGSPHVWARPHCYAASRQTAIKFRFPLELSALLRAARPRKSGSRLISYMAIQIDLANC
jgi:hypothetical protein